MRVFAGIMVISTALLAGCSGPEQSLSERIAAYNGDPATIDVAAVDEAVQTEGGRAAIADAIAGNPLLDMDRGRVAIVIHKPVVNFIEVLGPGDDRDVQIILPVLPGSPGDGVDTRVASVDLSEDTVTVIVEYGTDIAKYDVDIAAGGVINADIITGEVIDLDAQP